MQPISRLVIFMSWLQSVTGLDLRIESNIDTFGLIYIYTFGLFFENE